MRSSTMDEDNLTSDDWLDKFNDLHQFLQGKLPEGVKVPHPPKLSPQRAWDVIWFLQEVTRSLPDYFERCHTCGDIYDSEGGGVHISDENYKEEKRKKSDIGKNFCEPCRDAHYFRE